MNNFIQRVFLILLLALTCTEIMAASLILDSKHADGAAWNLTRCAACHPIRFIHRSAPQVRTIVQQKGYKSCFGCHGTNGSKEEEKGCIICHNSKSLPNNPSLDGRHSHNFTGSTSGLDDQACMVCHEASDMNGKFNPTIDLTQLPNKDGFLRPSYSITEFCLRCHNRSHQVPGYEIFTASRYDPLIAMEDNYPFIDRHGLRDGTGTRIYYGLRDGYKYATAVECTDCHAMHGTDNPSLIIDRSTKGVNHLSAAFRNQNWKVKIEDGNFSQLCVLCHKTKEQVEASETNTGNGLSGVHEVSGDCRPCHSHGQANQAGM